jgi:large subunit ribosomal protein L17
MRHHSTVKKFGREKDQRQQFFRSLLNNLITHESITTTLARAKAIRPMVEKLLTLAKTNTLHSRRLIVSRLGNNETTAKALADTIAPKFMETNGGYTRVVKLPRRGGDAAEMAVISFIK